MKQEYVDEQKQLVDNNAMGAETVPNKPVRKSRGQKKTPKTEKGIADSSKQPEENGDLFGLAIKPPPTLPMARNDNIYFMPVDRLRAQVFLSHGLIYPDAYDTAGAASDFDDIQRTSAADLLLFENPQPIKNNQLLLKVMLTSEEILDCDRIEEAIKFPMPLPISRLIGIEVSQSIEQLSSHLDGWVKPDVPVPRHLFKKVDSTHTISAQDVSIYASHSGGEPIPDINESIRRYDRYLGLMAYMRNAERYFSQKTSAYSDYPDLYFSCCSSLLNDESIPHSTDVKSVLSALLDIDSQTTPNQKELISLITSTDAYIEKEKAHKLAGSIYHESGKNQTLEQAFKDLFSGDYRSAVQKLQTPAVPSEAVQLAILHKYSSRQSNDHLNIKQRLHEDWTNPSQIAEALGVLGAYYGYTALTARETKLYSVNSQFNQLGSEKPAIKFHLESSFERQVIEALYQKAFYRQSTNDNVKQLYLMIPSNTAPQPTKLSGLSIGDKSFNVKDLYVRRYVISTMGKIINYLLELKSDFFDERSEVGKYLLHSCFFHAEEYELSRKGNREILHYKISKQKIIDLLSGNKIHVNIRVLEAALDEDKGSMSA